MVLVTVGTQKQSFIRMLKMVENSKSLENEEIIAQIGNTKFDSDKIKCFKFIKNEDMENYIEKADLIITHAGVGLIFECLHKNKRVIAVPRLKKYKEHINDHQLEICDMLEKEGYIISCLENDNLDEKINFIKSKELKKYERNEDFLEILKKEI